MSVTDSEIAYARDLFAGAGEITQRKMAGACCLYSDGDIFSVVGDGEIYIKARAEFAKILAAAGSRQFSITRADGSVGTNCYWTLPDPARDDPDQACAWARQALLALRTPKNEKAAQP